MTGLRGRWETLQKQPLVLCDTGHNSHGLQYVARQLKELPHPHVWIVFGMVNDKDTDVVMRLMPTNDKSQISNLKYHYIFTTPNTSRARTAEEMLTLWHQIHPESPVLSPEGEIALDKPQDAFAYALDHAAPEDAIFIGGSNYLVGDALSYFAH